MTLEEETMRRVKLRLVPFLCICFFVAYLDRVNVGFAALAMNKDLGLSATAYGFGAGLFFLMYFFFEVPSSLILAKFGARKWIARIMLTWGIISGAMAFAGGETSFYVLRALLGIAEAGFFPGIVFYLTLWVPSEYRGRLMGLFYLAVPLSNLIGAPISAWLLTFDGLSGLAGWRWLFLIEAAPSILLSFAVYFYLTDRPSEANWLTPEQRAWFLNKLEQEKGRSNGVSQFNIRQLVDRRVLGLAAVYFGAMGMLYGLGFFLPQIVKELGYSNLEVGIISAVPYLGGAIGMVLWTRRSDTYNERFVHCSVPLVVAAVGFALATVAPGPVWKMCAICIACLGIFAAIPVFWALPPMFFAGSAAAAGIAAVNSLGNLAGFLGPYATGYLRDVTGGFSAGFLAVATLGLFSAILVLFIRGQSSEAVGRQFVKVAE
jgi:MFS transporter, ACS family, tartrate transporter